MESAMRTNIDLDDELMERAMKATGERTKRAVVHRALRLLLAVESQGEIRKLRGRVRWEGDLTASRQGRVQHG
jgi:Arc/MetJ family transcription regulator